MSAGRNMSTANSADPGDIRVLHVIAHIEKAGAERQLSLLVKSSRHQHVIAVPTGNEAPSAAKVESLPSLSPVSIFKTVRKIIRENQIDIVQLWLPDRITIPAMLAAQAEGCAIISGDRRRVRNYGPGAVRDRLPYINHLFADLIIPNYPHLPGDLSIRRVLNFAPRTKTILNGVDIEPSAKIIDSKPSRLLFVGRFVEQKRVGELIGLLPGMLEDTSLTGLDIVGQGGLEGDYRNRIETLGLASKVTLHGRLSGWGKRFSPSENLLILPSTSEGMSNTLFEAIGYGFMPLVSRSPELDVILADWPARPEMFNPLDGNSIRAAIQRALALEPDELRNRTQAMQGQLEQFSIQRMVAAYDAVYVDLKAQRAHT